MEKIPKINSVLLSNCCETCRNIPQKKYLRKCLSRRIFEKDR